MELYVADADPEVCFSYGPCDIHGSSPAGIAHMNAVFRFTVNTSDLPVDPLTHEVFLLVLGMVSVRTQCENDLDVFRVTARLKESLEY